MTAIGHVVRYFRRHGLRQTLQRLVNRCIYGSQALVVTRVSLGGPPVVDRVGEIRLRLATPSDLRRLGDLERYDRRGSIIRARVEEDGDWLFVADHADRIVATRLVSRVVPPQGIISKVLTLSPRQVWGGEVFCVPEYRGRGIGRHLSLFGDRYVASLGYTEIFGAIAAANIPSLRMHLRKGVRFDCYVSYLRCLCYHRLRVTREIPTALTSNCETVGRTHIWQERDERYSIDSTQSVGKTWTCQVCGDESDTKPTS